MALKVFICGGGTGGHFFSGLAVAEDILDRFPTADIHFVGTRAGIEGRSPLPDARMQIHFISAKGVLGKSLLSQVKALMVLVRGFFECVALLYQQRPHVIIGVGGYASAPPVAAALMWRWIARWMHRPSRRSIIAVLEQNSYAGFANQMLRRLGAQAFSAFPENGFTRIDLPLRKALQSLKHEGRPVAWPPQCLLIMGGSQGARSLNARWRELILEAPSFFRSYHFVHQTGLKDEAEMREFYASLHLTAEVFAFSSDMPRYYRQADCIICRSGAMTVFEVLATERPAIFVPFPAATHDHQYLNAVAVHDREWVVREEALTSQKVISLLTVTRPPLPRSGTSGAFVDRLGLEDL